MIRINIKFIYERSWWQNLFLVLVGVFLVSFGSAVNFCAGLGNDPVSVLFNGISSKFGISLGTAANFFNVFFFIVAFIFGKHFLGLGTFLYVLCSGKFIDTFVFVYRSLIPWQNLPVKILSALIGCFVMLFGVVLMVVSTLGVDVWTASAMALSNFFKIDYKKFKIFFDGLVCLLGFILGGTVGVTTLFLVIIGGPFVKVVSKKLEKVFL